MEAYSDGMSFPQSFGVTKKISFHILWLKALRSKTTFFCKRLKSFFMDELLSGTRSEIRRFFSQTFRSNYFTVDGQSQLLRDSVWVARLPALLTLAVGNSRAAGFRRGTRMLQVQTFSAEGQSIRDQNADCEVLVLTGFYSLLVSQSTNSSSAFSNH